MSPENNPLARGVCSRLDEGVEALPSALTDRLEKARYAALARTARPVQRPSSVLSFLKGFDQWLSGSTRWVAPAMLLAGVIGFLSYQHYQSLQDLDELDVDVALLSSDLPLDAYLDRGFANWVRVNETKQGGTSCGPRC